MRILFRTEGNHKQGMGDLWGSIALANSCSREQDEILFMLSGGDEALEILGSKGYSLEIAETIDREKDILNQFRPDVAIVNKLNNPLGYIKLLKRYARITMTIDDSGEGAQHADLRINVLYHSPGAITDPKYIALRKEFQEIHKKEKLIKKDIEELFITQGGSDTYGFIPRIIQSLDRIKIHPHCTVVIGPAFRHHEALKKVVEASSLDLRVIYNASNMAELMAKSDLAITAGGLTMFELACTGTPAIVICGERFEVETASRFEKGGIVKNLGFGEDLEYFGLVKVIDELAVEPAKREQMSHQGKKLVDGLGAERIIMLIREHLEGISRGHS